MKKATIIYKIMSVVMLVACIAFALFLSDKVSITNFILPTCAVIVFIVYSFIIKGKSVKDRFLNNIYLSHTLVVLTLIQAMVVFNIDILTTIIIVTIGVIMNVFLVVSLKVMLKKIGVNDAKD
jgi:4-hydroxybenzoate polyprenyltransferase